MGYGGTREDAGQAFGQAGDGGIDGIIKEDRLGLDIVYLQAKRCAHDYVSRIDAKIVKGPPAVGCSAWFGVPRRCLKTTSIRAPSTRT